MKTYGEDFLFDYTNLLKIFVVLRWQETGVEHDEEHDTYLELLESHDSRIKPFLASIPELKQQIFDKITEGEPFWGRQNRAMSLISEGKERQARDMDALDNFSEGERKYYQGLNPLLKEVSERMEKVGIDWRTIAR